MKFGFLSEGDTPAGMTHYHRMWEIVDEVILAEKVGFDWFGTSEQHFTVGGASVSSPEILYSYLFARTDRIRFRHASAHTATRINHPLRTAERVATEDILSNGRIELGLARGNSTGQLRAFEVDLDTTRPQLEEALRLIRTVFTQTPFKYESDMYKIPPRFLVPFPIQTPHPPLYVAATSKETHAWAGAEGLGVLSNSNFGGFDAQKELVDAYRSSFDAADHSGIHPTYSIGSLAFISHCSRTREDAYREAWPIFRDYVPTLISGYKNMAKHSESYKYMGTIIERLEQVMGGIDRQGIKAIDELIETTGTVVLGSPEDCVTQIERFRECGLTEMILRLDTVEHSKLMQSIELFGKYVIPAFKAPQSIQRPTDDNIEAIRAMRS